MNAKAATLAAADHCRAIQQTYHQQAKRARRKDIKDILYFCATGAGACAADIEARAGLTLEQIAKRAILAAGGKSNG